MINHFTFNGTSTADLGLIVSGVSIFGAGSRKVEKAGIPGRNGDLQIELGGFNNYTVRYTVSITNDFTTTAQQIREWLLESKGYCDLTDTYHPDEIRKACFNSDIEFTTSMLYKYGQASIQFDCLPERYLTTNTPITTTATADTTTDTTLSLSTVPTPITISLNGNTTQEGTPSPTNPQVIHSVSGDNTVFVSGKNMWGGTKMVSDIKKALPSATADFTNNIITYGANTDGNINPNLTADITFKPTTDYTIILSVSSNSATASTNMYVLFTDGTIEYINKPQALAEKQVFAFHPNRLNKSIQGIHKVWASGTSTFYADECGLFEGNIELEDFEVFGAQSYPLYLPVENLLEDNVTVSQNANFTVTRRADGGLVINGTATSTALVVYNFETDQPSTNQNPQKRTLPVGTYHGCTHCANTGIKIQVVVSNNSAVGGTGASGLPSVYDGDITITDDYAYNWIRLILSAGTYNNEIVYPQIEKGTKANAYHPYGTTPIELNKIGTYQDYIYKNGGKWYVHKATASVDMGTLTYQTDNGGVYFYSSVSGKGRTNFDLLCTCYTVTTSTNTSGMTDYQIKGQTSGAYIFIKDSRYTVATDLKTALSGQTLKYNLATATNTEITDTTLLNQLNNIEKAYSYNGTTNILQVSNDNGFMLGVVSLHGSTFTSNYKGEPIITVNSTGLIYLNGEVMEVLSAPVTINCQTMQCYNGVVNMNNEVRVNDFPEIKIGSNEVGSSMALTITPNNWRH